MNASVVFFIISLRHDTPTLLDSTDILKSSTRRLVTSVEFSKAQYLTTLTHFHGCCSLFNVVRTKRMMRAGDILDEVGNNHRIIVFSHTKLIMKVNPWMEVT